MRSHLTPEAPQAGHCGKGLRHQKGRRRPETADGDLPPSPAVCPYERCSVNRVALFNLLLIDKWFLSLAKEIHIECQGSVNPPL